jgi:DNA-binding MarR family transcriptional regulator
VKKKEYLLLDAIAQDPHVTQAGLAKRFGIAVGSVNWYIKRLISRGYLKATRMDRTRLMYNLTPEGMSALTKRASQYMKDSLKVYKHFRQEAKSLVAELLAQDVEGVYLEGDDETMDIMRLTCIETGIQLESSPSQWVISSNGRHYRVQENLSRR